MKYALIFAFFGTLVMVNLIYSNTNEINVNNKHYKIQIYNYMGRTYINAFVMNTCEFHVKANKMQDLNEVKESVIKFLTLHCPR